MKDETNAWRTVAEQLAAALLTHCEKWSLQDVRVMNAYNDLTHSPPSQDVNMENKDQKNEAETPIITATEVAVAAILKAADEADKETATELRAIATRLTASAPDVLCDIDEYGDERDMAFLVATGYNDCIIGHTMYQPGFGSAEDVRLVYDSDAIIAKLVADGLEPDEAEEYFEYNIIGGYVGPKTPLYIQCVRFRGQPAVEAVGKTLFRTKDDTEKSD